MKIQELSTSEIKAYKKNIKKHPEPQIKRIAESIKQFGFTQPIVIDNSGEIIAGHGRFAAAQLLNLPTVPVVRLETLSQEEIRAYRILDNELAMESPWNYNELCEELGSLDEFKNSMGESWHFDSLLDEATKNLHSFAPRLEPTTTNPNVNNESMEVAKQNLLNEIQSFNRRGNLDMVCPECGASFQVKT